MPDDLIVPLASLTSNSADDTLTIPLTTLTGRAARRPASETLTVPLGTLSQTPAETLTIPLTKLRGEVTSLSDADETKFQSWAKANRITDVDAPDSYYDYRGYWKSTGGASHPPGAQQHFPDTFKQHGHPTFSVESQYSKGPGDGGTWDGDTYVPQGQQPKAPFSTAPDMEGAGAFGEIASQSSFAQGPGQMVRGIRALATSLPTTAQVAQPDTDALWQQMRYGEVQGPNLSPETKNALSETVEGFFNTTAPLVGAGLAVAPVRTLIALGSTVAASKAAALAVTQAGGDDASARLAGNIAALMAGGVGVDRVLAEAKRGVTTLKETASTAAAGVGKTARAAAVATKLAMPPEAMQAAQVAKAGIHAPIEAIDSGVASQHEAGNQLSAPPETFTEAILASPAADFVRESRGPGLPTPGPTLSVGLPDTLTVPLSVVSGQAAPAPSDQSTRPDAVHSPTAPETAASSTPESPVPSDVRTVAAQEFERLRQQAIDRATATKGTAADVPNTPEAQELERLRNTPIPSEPRSVGEGFRAEHGDTDTDKARLLAQLAPYGESIRNMLDRADIDFDVLAERPDEQAALLKTLADHDAQFQQVDHGDPREKALGEATDRYVTALAQRLREPVSVGRGQTPAAAATPQRHGIGYEQMTEAELRDLLDTGVRDEPSLAATELRRRHGSDVTIHHNTDKGSIEVAFAAKPAPEVLAQLKAAGFRWAKSTRVWYQKMRAGMNNPRYITEHDRLVAKVREITGSTAERTQGSTQTPATPEPKVDLWKNPLGQNIDGQTLFEDARGVRYRIEKGIRITEPVSMVPTRGGMAVSPRSPRGAEWEVSPAFAPVKMRPTAETPKPEAESPRSTPAEGWTFDKPTDAAKMGGIAQLLPKSQRKHTPGAIGSIPTERGWIARYEAPDGQVYYSSRAFQIADTAAGYSAKLATEHGWPLTSNNGETLEPGSEDYAARAKYFADRLRMPSELSDAELAVRAEKEVGPLRVEARREIERRAKMLPAAAASLQAMSDVDLVEMMQQGDDASATAAQAEIARRHRDESGPAAAGRPINRDDRWRQVRKEAARLGVDISQTDQPEEAEALVDAAQRTFNERQANPRGTAAPAKARVVPVPDGWDMVVGKTRTKEGHTFEAEVDWQHKRIVFADATHMANPEIRNHEIGHIIVEAILPDADRKALFEAYIKALDIDEWEVKNQFHRERLAIDLTPYLTHPEQTDQRLVALFDKYVAPYVPGAVAAPTEEAQNEPDANRPVAGREESPADTHGQGGRRPTDGEREPGTAPRARRDVAGQGAGTDAGRSISPDARPVRGGRQVRPFEVTEAAVAPEYYRITDADKVGTGSQKERVARNLAAIRVLKTLEAEQRRATPEEQSILVKYVGWGGLSRIFEPWKNVEGDNTPSQYWQEALRELQNLLEPAELATARNSTQNAHYTSPTVIKGMWDAVARLLGSLDQVQHASILEPSAGVGHFLGLAPDAVRGAAWAMVEKDAITAAIIKALYPGAFAQHSAFEKATLPDGHFALAISNVPFGAIPITDPAFNGPPYLLQRIHNYFFAKSLEKVAPGGLVAFITTQGSLDSRQATRVREYLGSKADFLGAIRLPYTAFKANAGTEVVTDMLFFRRRHAGQPAAHVAPWIETQPVTLANKEGAAVEFYVNEYFHAHPEMVLGKQAATGKMRQADTYNVEPSGDLATQLAAAVQHLPHGVVSLTPPETSLQAFTDKQAPIGTRPYEFLVHEGQLAQVIDGEMVAVDMTGADEARVRALLPIRVALRTLYDHMAEDAEDATIEADQAALTKVYDKFVAKHGPIARDSNWTAFREDPDLPLLLSLEDYDPERDTATKTAIFTKRTLRAARKALKADSPDQALLVALGETGRIDLDRVGALLGVGPEQAAAALMNLGLIIDTPQGWQLPEVYLSGNVRVKHAEAAAAAELNPRYQAAADRLKAVVPTDIPAFKIMVRLGASWVPADLVQAFIGSVVGSDRAAQWKVTYLPADARWDIEGSPSSYSSRFDTPDANTKDLLLDALNDRRRTIKRRNSLTGVTTVDRQATNLARQRKEDIHKAFTAWLLKDEGPRREWAVRTYNDLFNSYVEPKIDGAFLSFPGMAEYWRDKMAAHQRNAVARILLFGNTLLAHVVGAGKTLEMVAAMMEQRRLGISRKPMLVVPNHLISQAPAEFLSYYPTAKVLVVTADDLQADKRKRFTARIAAGDYDAVIVPYSAFVRISMSAEAEAAYQTAIKDEIETAIIQEWASITAASASQRGGARQGRGSRTPPSVKRLENMRDRIDKRLQQLKDRPKDDMLNFEQLGVDALYVDEAHSFKNLYFPTRQQAAGIPADNNAQRATDLYLKARYINQLSGYRNVVLATGTPVSNSMAEIFVMQKLLQEQVLERANIAQFDAWLAQFGHIVAETELDPSGTGLSARPRLKSFRNLPDLAAMFRQVADVKMIDDLPWLKDRRPKLRGGAPTIVRVPLTQGQSRLLTELEDRADNLDPKDRRADNMVKITGEGRAGMLDMRLLDRRLKDEKGSKIHVVAESVADIYKQTRAVKGTQLVFLDAGTPGSEERSTRMRKSVDAEGNVITRPPTDVELNRGFDLYADLKKKLIKAGVREDEIAFIHDVDKVPEKKRDGARRALFKAVRDGKIRVLVGSTNKMGTGMNVQDRLVALHNVDPAWKPSDIEQRNGRILRQGNLFATKGSPLYDQDFAVQIFHYVATGAGQQFGFDAYMWQLNEVKAAIISRFFAGNLTERDLSLDLEQTVLTASEMKAVATGNPLILEFAKVQGEVERLESVKAGWEESHREAEYNERVFERHVAEEQQKRARFLATAPAITERTEPDDATATIQGKTVTGFTHIGEALIAAAKKATRETSANPAEWTGYNPVEVGTFRGLTMTIHGNGTNHPWVVLRHPDEKVAKYAEANPDKAYATARVDMLVPDEEGPGGLQWAHPTGLMTRINNRLANIVQEANDHSFEQYYADKLRAAQQMLHTPFEQAADLKAARAKMEELSTALGIRADQQQEVEEIDEGDTESESTTDGETVPATKKKPGGGGTTLQMAIVPGLKEFVEGDVAPGAAELLRMIKESAEGLQLLFAPASVSVEAERGAGALRPSIAGMWQKTQRARKTMEAASAYLDKLYVQKASEGDPVAVSRFLVFTDVMEGIRPAEDIEDAVERAVAIWARKTLDGRREIAVKLRLLQNYFEHYFPHEWKDAKGAKALFGKRPLQGRESYRRKRSIPTVREGVERGLEPAHWNPVELVLRKLLEMDKSIMARRYLRSEAKRAGTAKYVPVGKKAPEGWVRYPESIGTVYGARVEEQTFGRVVAGYYYGPRDAVRILERYLSPGLSGRVAAFDLFRTVSNSFVQLKLALSVFHGLTTGLESVVSKMDLALQQATRGQWKAAAKSLAEIPVAPVVDIIRGDRWLREFYATDAVSRAVHGIVQEVVQAGGGFGWDIFEHSEAPQRFMEAIRKGNYPGAAFRAIPALIELQAVPIMKWWVPRLKMAAFHERARMELASLGPNPDLAEVRRVLGQQWDTIDDRFGQIIYRNWFWFNSMKEIGQASLLSLGWNGGSLRLMGGAIPGQMARMGLIPSGGGRGGFGKRPLRRVSKGRGPNGERVYADVPEPFLHYRMSWFISLMVIGGLVDAMYQFYNTGELPKDAKDVVMPRNGRLNADGSPQRVFLPGYMKDVLAWTSRPFTTAIHKVNPFISYIIDSIENTDYRGVQYRDESDPAAVQLKAWLAFTLKEMAPISTERAAESGLESYLGINPAPRDLTQTTAEAKLSAIQDRKGHPTLTPKQGAARDARTALRRGLQAGTPEGRAQADEALRSRLLTQRQVRNARKATGETYLQRGFASLTLDEALEVYEVASPEERQSVYREMVTKMRRFNRGTAGAADTLVRLNKALRLPRAVGQARTATQ